MVEFIPAKELIRNFNVFGHFYLIHIAPKKVVQCRGVLEIVDSACRPRTTAALSSRKPDAVVIMMNPGSSRPFAQR